MCCRYGVFKVHVSRLKTQRPTETRPPGDWLRHGLSKLNSVIAAQASAPEGTPPRRPSRDASRSTFF